MQALLPGGFADFQLNSLVSKPPQRVFVLHLSYRSEKV